MSVKPILFNTEMVKAILDGRKSCTRRVIKPQPNMKLCYIFAGCGNGKWSYPSKDAWNYWGEEFKHPEDMTYNDLQIKWNPPYHTDDILYVRETWADIKDFKNYMEYEIPDDLRYLFKCDDNGETHQTIDIGVKKWHPSIHMPKSAARIWLKVTDVRVERLQDMSGGEILKEGIDKSLLFDGNISNAFDKFKQLWDSTIKKSEIGTYGWDANPYVWVIEFEGCEKPEE